MPRYKAIVDRIEHGRAHLALEDGTRLTFPLDKLPEGLCEGTFLSISVRIDRIAALLSRPHKPLVPKGAKP